MQIIRVFNEKSYLQIQIDRKAIVILRDRMTEWRGDSLQYVVIKLTFTGGCSSIPSSTLFTPHGFHPHSIHKLIAIITTVRHSRVEIPCAL